MQSNSPKGTLFHHMWFDIYCPHCGCPLYLAEGHRQCGECGDSLLLKYWWDPEHDCYKLIVEAVHLFGKLPPKQGTAKSNDNNKQNKSNGTKLAIGGGEPTGQPVQR